MEQRAEIICSYFKMNNKDDEFKISLGNKKFSIIKNNKAIFNYGYMEYQNNIVFMEFCMKSSMIKKKIFDIFSSKQINYIITKKSETDYWFGTKYIYCDTIELNKNSYIYYDFNKTYIHFTCYIYNGMVAINYKICIRYFNRLIYKYYDKYNSIMSHFKYTDYKIIIPNKYELLYYSKYFHFY